MKYINLLKFKAVNKVWHNSLIYKLKQKGVAGDLLDTLTNFDFD